MKIRLERRLAVMLLLPSLCLAGSDKPVSLDDYLLRIQLEGPRTIVTYCANEVPELQIPLEAEYQRYSDNIAIAIKPLKARLGQKMSEPISPDDMQFPDLGKKILESIKKYPPENYCPWLLGNMKKTSPEALQAKIEAAYARYEALAAERRPESVK